MKPPADAVHVSTVEPSIAQPPTSTKNCKHGSEEQVQMFQEMWRCRMGATLEVQDGRERMRDRSDRVC